VVYGREVSTPGERTLIAELGPRVGGRVCVKGWIHRLRETKTTTFIILTDCSGVVQIVAAPDAVKDAGLAAECPVKVVGGLRADERAPGGFEIDLETIEVLAPVAANLPFTSVSKLDQISQDLVLDYRPMSLRTQRGSTIFRVEAALVEAFRTALRRRRFTEILTSKIVAGGTEGGSNLFAIKYFDRVAYLAQSPQFYKEHGVAGLERVFETGHVYRAEPHATSRHLTEYYSLDFEMGFIDGPRDVIEMEREILSEMFATIAERFADSFKGFDVYLPSLEKAPVWEFTECLERLRRAQGRTDLQDDLDPPAERELCAMAEKESGVAAAFVVGFPLTLRPFYTHPAADGVHAAGFDLLFRGVEITTGGQRLHRRADLEASLRSRGIDPAAFEPHLRMFDLGMPPHGGLAIGLERLTSQVLGLKNVREATLYPRDRTRVEP
jgi:nondiscriminating aspartyl-tRNA synthetase